ARFRAHPRQRQGKGLEIHLVAGDARTQVRIGQFARRVGPEVALGELAEVARRAAGAAAAPEPAGDVLALVLQQALGDLPAAVQPADQVALRDLHVGEEGLAERALAADQLDRPRLDAGGRHVDQHERDALVLLRRRVGAHQAEAPVGEVGVAGPDLLAIDQPVVALVLAAGLQRGEVRPRARLGVALAPADLAVDDLRDVLGLLLFAGELQQHRPQHPQPERGERAAVAGQLLLEDARLVGREAAAAVLLRPGRRGPAARGDAAHPDDLRIVGADELAPAPDRVVRP